jgi:hypothetical protein
MKTKKKSSHRVNHNEVAMLLDKIYLINDKEIQLHVAYRGKIHEAILYQMLLP